MNNTIIEVNITKKKKIHRYRGRIGHYHWGKGRSEGAI